MANKMLMKVLGKDDFDMEEYDRAMAAAFDDSYYEVGCAPHHTATNCLQFTVSTYESWHRYDKPGCEAYIHMIGQGYAVRHQEHPLAETHQ